LKVNIEHVEAYSPIDKERVLDLIQDSIGFDRVNDTVRANMIQWVATVVQWYFHSIAYNDQTDLGQTRHSIASIASHMAAQGHLRVCFTMDHEL